MKVAAIFSFAQHFSRFGERSLRQIARRFDRAFFSKELDFVPVFPSFQWLAVCFAGESNAKALFDVQSNDLDARAAGKVRTFLPECAVRRVVEFSDS